MTSDSRISYRRIRVITALTERLSMQFCDQQSEPRTRPCATWAEWAAFLLAVLAALFAASILLAQTPTEKTESAVPVKVVQPVPSSDTTLAAVWMASISGILALGSAALQAYTARKTAADKMAFDAELIRLRTECTKYETEFQKCEERSQKLEEEVGELRARLKIAEEMLTKLKGV